jgi:hypothetical protein
MRTALLLAAFAGSTTAHATATPIAEFVGDHFENWESDDYGFTSCYRVDDAADMCSSSVLDTTSSWGFACSILSFDGNLMGDTGNTTTFTFDEAVGEFGGQWGTNNGEDTAFFTFYNAAGGIVDTAEIAFDCGIWQWGGWSFSEPVATVEVYLEGTHLMSDNISFSEGDGGGDLTLTTDGDCPGVGNIAISGDPGGRFVIVAGDREGSTVIPAGRCAGTVLGVESVGTLVKFGPIPDLDSDGLIELTPTLPPGMCSKHVQVIDVNTCEVSDVSTFGS